MSTEKQVVDEIIQIERVGGAVVVEITSRCWASCILWVQSAEEQRIDQTI